MKRKPKAAWIASSILDEISKAGLNGVDFATLSKSVWGDYPPSDVGNTLRVHIKNLRKRGVAIDAFGAVSGRYGNKSNYRMGQANGQSR
jgi:sugar phosphate isomerase/epimerase